MSDQNLANELTHATKLNPKRRGELAELAFMRKAATLGFAVAKPWGDSDRYDVIVRFEKTFWRVQIKSVLTKCSGRTHYRFQTRDSSRNPYSPNDIDFLVGYVFPEDLWYVFPVQVIAHSITISVRPGFQKSRFEQYREKWDLMRPRDELRTIAPDCPLAYPCRSGEVVPRQPQSAALNERS